MARVWALRRKRILRLGWFRLPGDPEVRSSGWFWTFLQWLREQRFFSQLGENYPFQFNFSFFSPNDINPYVYNGCTTAGPIGNATLETGFSCTPLDPLLVNANGLGLRGIQFKYITPYSMSGNFTLQYQLTPSLSVQTGYVTSLARHLEVFRFEPGHATLAQPRQHGCRDRSAKTCSVPGFGYGSSYATTDGNSYYHGLQVKVEKQFAAGLNFLGTYTWSKVRSDALDLLNGFSGNGYRAPQVPGFGFTTTTA